MKAIVLQVNGLGSGWLGPYGNEWVETFHFDRLASESIVFDNHLGDRPHPELAWKSLWSGRYSFADRDQNPSPPLAGITRTILMHDRDELPYPAHEWDIVLDARPDEDETPVQAFVATLEAALDIFDEEENGLLWIETSLLLPPWCVELERFRKYAVQVEEPIAEDEEDEGELVEEEIIDEEPQDEEEEPFSVFDPEVGRFEGKDPEWDFLHSSFAAMVEEFDDTLATIREALSDRRLDEKALLMVTSDRGQPLGEHGIVGEYRPYLHEELVHLPLIVRLPGGKQGGRRVSALTQPVDVLPTLREWFAAPSSEAIHGRSLLPLTRSEAEKLRDYAIVGLKQGQAEEVGMRTPDRYLIVPIVGEIDDPPRKPMLFEKPHDRSEVNDLHQHNLDWSDAAEKVLKEFISRCGEAGFQPPPLES